MKNKILSFILATILILPNVAFGQVEAQVPKPTQEADLAFFIEILDLIEEDYPFETDESELIEGAVKGMLRSVDDYSDYYTRDEAEEMFSDITGMFSGIGVYLMQEGGKTYVDGTIKGQPAEQAGIKKGDLILSIEHKDIVGKSLEEISLMIKGEVGTQVRIRVERDGEAFNFDVPRANITVNPVKYELIEGSIGYIRLDSFNTRATQEMANALDFFEGEGIEKIILDIRDNPGGLFQEAVEIAKLFVPKGNIVHQRMKGDELVTYKAFEDGKNYELALLVNERSASSSEILAGAIKDRGAGTIIGKTTFGKGVVQTLVPITDGSIVKLTTAEYLTPGKISIDGKGIEPDIEVENNGLDLQFEKAVELLK